MYKCKYSSENISVRIIDDALEYQPDSPERTNLIREQADVLGNVIEIIQVERDDSKSKLNQYLEIAKDRADKDRVSIMYLEYVKGVNDTTIMELRNELKEANDRIALLENQLSSNGSDQGIIESMARINNDLHADIKRLKDRNLSYFLEVSKLNQEFKQKQKEIILLYLSELLDWHNSHCNDEIDGAIRAYKSVMEVMDIKCPEITYPSVSFDEKVDEVDSDSGN